MMNLRGEFARNFENLPEKIREDYPGKAQRSFLGIR